MRNSGECRRSLTECKLLIVVIGLLLITSITPAASGMQATNAEMPSNQSSVETFPAYPQQSAPNNSSVVRHENPSEESSEGDLAAVSSRLARSLGGDLRQGSIRINRGQYERAKNFVGPEYRKKVARYVEVAEETETESDDQIAERLNQTGANQRQLANQLDKLNQTRARYREARQQGNESGARDLARQMRQIADGLEATRGELAADYSEISKNTSVNLSEESSKLNETVAQQTTEVEQIQDVEFEETTLTVRTTGSPSNASFEQPVQIQGRLTASEEPLADRAIQLQIGIQTIETETDGEGQFNTEYRPVTLRTGVQELDVRYVPQNESEYQRSNDTVRVAVSQVTPDVTVSLNSSEVRFNDTLQIDVAVSVDNTTVPYAPISAFVAGERVSRNDTIARTNEEGEYVRTVRIPLRFSAGEQPVRVVIGNDTRAIARGETRTEITVRPTEVRLVVEARQLNESATGPSRRTILTRGRLTTENGTPIGGQFVELAVGGNVMATVKTNNNGRFNQTIQVPSRFLPTSVGEQGRVEITAVYSDEDTNLASNTAMTALFFQAELLNVVGQNLSWSSALATVFILGSAVALRRRYDKLKIEDAPGAATGVSLGAAGSITEGTPDDASLLELADRWLEAGRTSVAVQFAYAAARARFVEAYDVSPDRTHWAFYQTCRAVSGDDLEDFERLTALYERAAFANHPVEQATTRKAYLLAEEIRDDLDAETAAGVKTREANDSTPEASEEASPAEVESDD